MLTTNANFDVKHVLDQKAPMYLVHFDGEPIDYCNHAPSAPDNVVNDYLVKISGLGQKVQPEEGRASIGGLTVEILDKGDALTAIIATDPYFFHRRKVTIKAGYRGMTEADMITIFTGWVTDLKLNSTLTSYVFSVTDPQKWMQRKIFRVATSIAPVIIQGNPINILLALLTSTGLGTNGDYDWYAEENGLGLDTDFVNVTEIEQARDRWYPGDSHYMQFTIKDREVAKDFMEREIFKVLNCYPIIDGHGRFSIKPFKPPLAALETTQSFDENNIIDLPAWDANLSSLINEVEVFYNRNAVTDEFDDEIYYVDADSVDNRGPGKKSLSIKSKGLHSTGIGSQPDRTTDIITSRKSKVFGRFATPPIKVDFKAWFSRWISEAGDIVPFTHWLIPDIITGLRGYTSERMEIISRDIDWAKGQVKFELLNTGFDKRLYAVISPIMTITAVTSPTDFTVSVTDAARYSEDWVIDVFDSAIRPLGAGYIIATIDKATGVITIDNSLLDTISTGTFRIATVATGAMIYCSDLDLTPYVGMFIWIEDSAGKHIGGYVQEACGGESVGINLCSNGDFTTWAGDDPGTWNLSQAEDVDNYVTENPGGQCQYVADSLSFSIYQTILTEGSLYLVGVDVKAAASGSCYVQAGAATAGIICDAPGIQSEYKTAAGTAARIRRNTAPADITLDDITFKLVSDLPVTGVKIMSTPGGGTQSWTYQEAGFDANDIVTVEVWDSYPAVDSVIQFAHHDYLTETQKLYWALRETGAALITP